MEKEKGVNPITELILLLPVLLYSSLSRFMSTAMVKWQIFLGILHLKQQVGSP